MTIPTSSAPNLSELPFLLRLLDDPSPTVQKKVAIRLRELGIAIWPEIERLNLTLSPSQRLILELSLASSEAQIERSPESFLQCLHLPSENRKLEAAYRWLSCLRWGPEIGGALGERLESLAREYLEYSGTPDPEDLSVFLFQYKELRGADSDRFYDPDNSDLISVLESGRGIPISLTSIFMLVGARLDITITGCNFPGHFLARAPLDMPPNGFPAPDFSFLNERAETDLIFDCFNGGRVLSAAEVGALRKTAELEFRNPASAATIINRVLLNMAGAHHTRGERESAIYFLELRRQLEEADKKLSQK